MKCSLFEFNPVYVEMSHNTSKLCESCATCIYFENEVCLKSEQEINEADKLLTEGYDYYLSYDDLQPIKKYAGSYECRDPEFNVNKLISFLQGVWWKIGASINVDAGTLRLSTGGWKSNEIILDVLRNSVFWIYWKKSVRGGFHYFDIPEGTENDND